jgi:GTP-binding protein
LQRTRLLLHIVDIAPTDENASPVAGAKAIIEELRKYDDRLYQKPRWLVLNKIDLIPGDERQNVIREINSEYRRNIGEPENTFAISALSKEGCAKLTYAVMDRLSELAKDMGASETEDSKLTDGASA